MSIAPKIYLVVIAGGSGTRFWPKSTSKRPKQLLSFGKASNFGEEKAPTLLGQTLSRFDGLVPEAQKLIVTTSLLKEAIEEEGIEVKILAEPQGRNTAPCVYWAAKYIEQNDPKGVMLVMPSDHYIADTDAFRSVIRSAIEWATLKNDLVTLGIQPSRPETGYGYLKTGHSLSEKGATPGRTPYQVEAFIEKPDLPKAREFFSSGNHLWNGGMFVWRVDVILKAFDTDMPEMKMAWEQNGGDIQAAYPKMTATSIDYGIMEKAKNVVAFHLDCGWDDLGSWTSLESLAERLQIQKNSNIVNSGDLLAIDAIDNIIDVGAKRLIALLGVKDLIIAEQGEALLIAHKDRAQDIRKVVDEVKKRRPELA